MPFLVRSVLGSCCFNFVPPYRIVEKVEPYAVVLVICVYSVCAFGLSGSPVMLAYCSALVLSAASAYILAAPSNPFRCRYQIVEYLEFSIVRDRHYLFPTSSCCVWSFGRSVLFEVLPSFSRSLLHPLGHVLAPSLSFVVRFVTFEELTCTFVSRWLYRRQI